MVSLGKGVLVVATPMLNDPNFHQTVVLIVEHSTAGSVGVVLNRPGANLLVDHLPQLHERAGEPAVFFEGGPVQPHAVLVLGRTTAVALSDDDTVAPGISLVDVESLELTGDAIRELRVFSGYAGWGAGQLRSEIDEGAWWVLPALTEDTFTTEPLGLWRAALQRQPGRVQLFARFPPDLSHN